MEPKYLLKHGIKIYYIFFLFSCSINNKSNRVKIDEPPEFNISYEPTISIIKPASKNTSLDKNETSQIEKTGFNAVVIYGESIEDSDEEYFKLIKSFKNQDKTKNVSFLDKVKKTSNLFNPRVNFVNKVLSRSKYVFLLDKKNIHNIELSLNSNNTGFFTDIAGYTIFAIKKANIAYKNKKCITYDIVNISLATYSNSNVACMTDGRYKVLIENKKNVGYITPLPIPSPNPEPDIKLNDE